MRRTSIAVLAIALAAAACGGGDPSVANVNGTDIHQSAVTDLRASEEVVMDSGEFREDLTTIIFQTIVATGLDTEFGVTLDRDEARRAMLEELEAQGSSVSQELLALGETAGTEELLVHNTYSAMLVDAALGAVATGPEFGESIPGIVEAILAENPRAFTTVCARHVLVETEEEAVDVAERLAAGEDFATVAGEVSLDVNTPGGDLGCAQDPQYVAPFQEAVFAAPIGELTDPVQTEFGWHVILVYDRTEPSIDEIAADPRATLGQQVQDAWVQWFNDHVDAAEVEVSSRIGSWFPEGPGILPPE